MASDLDPVADLLVPGLSLLLDDLTQAVIVLDHSGQIQLLNVAARRKFPKLELGDELKRDDEVELTASAGGRRRQLADGWHAWVTCDIDPDQATDPDQAPDHLGDFVLEASWELAVGASRDAVAEALVRLAVPRVGEQAAVLLPAPRARVSWWRFDDGGEPAAGVARAPAPRAAPMLAGALRGDVDGPAAVPAGEVAALAAIFGPGLAQEVPVLVAPLRGPDRTEGLLIVVRPRAQKLLAQLAALAGPAVGASRQRREQASALDLLQAPLQPAPPDALPDLPGVQFGVAYQAAGELSVGGDFYLIRPTSDGGALLTLGDVCGKGAEALAESGRVQHSLGALMLLEQDPTRLLYLLNRALLTAGRTVFTTLVLGSLQPAEVGCRLTLATGGHPAPLVLRADGRVDEVGVPGTVVGILPEARFGRTSITLEPGETCLLYSDGVTEAGSGTGESQEQFGSARLAACLRDCVGMTAQEVAEHVEHTITTWLGRNDGDDLAVLAVRAVDRAR